MTRCFTLVKENDISSDEYTKLKKEIQVSAQSERTALQHSAAAIDVFQFLSAVEYLKKVFEHVKKRAGTYSYREFSADLGFGATNYLHLICTGKRPLSAKAALRMEEFLGLASNASHYFVTLAKYQNARRASERETLFETLVALKSKTLSNTLSRDQLEYFSEWYHPVVRELVTLPDFQPTGEWISSRILPRITPDQGRRSLELLERIGFLKRDPETGAWSQSAARVSTPHGAQAMALIRYHQKMIDLGKESITRVKSARRDISALTLTVSESLAQEIKEDIQAFKKAVLEKAESSATAGESIYQLNIQLFPVTEGKK